MLRSWANRDPLQYYLLPTWMWRIGRGVQIPTKKNKGTKYTNPGKEKIHKFIQSVPQAPSWLLHWHLHSDQTGTRNTRKRGGLPNISHTDGFTLPVALIFVEGYTITLAPIFAKLIYVAIVVITFSIIWIILSLVLLLMMLLDWAWTRTCSFSWTFQASGLHHQRTLDWPPPGH